MGAAAVSMGRTEDSGVFLLPPTEAITERDEDADLVFALLANDARAWQTFQKKYDRLILRCITKVTKRFSRISQEDVREILRDPAGLAARERQDEAPHVRSRARQSVLELRSACWPSTAPTTASARSPRAPQEALSEAVELPSEHARPLRGDRPGQRARMAAGSSQGFSERDRTFAALYFGEGMEPHEIARWMNISVKTVYSKKHKVKARLESLLRAEDPALAAEAERSLRGGEAA